MSDYEWETDNDDDDDESADDDDDDDEKETAEAREERLALEVCECAAMRRRGSCEGRASLSFRERDE